MLNTLLAGWGVYVVDIVAAVVLLLFAIIAAKRGFVDCLFGLISTIAAIAIAFLLMKPVIEWTGGLFGLQGLIENGCINGLSKVEGMNVDISAAGIAADLADKNLPQFLIDMVVESVGNSDVPQGTTIAMLVGEELGGLAVSLIAWLVLFLLGKLLMLLLKGIVSAIVENLPLVGTLNHILGFFVGALEGLLVVSAIVAVLSIIPIEGMINFFNECAFVGWLYNHNPINTVLGWILV